MGSFSPKMADLSFLGKKLKYILLKYLWLRQGINAI